MGRSLKMQFKSPSISLKKQNLQFGKYPLLFFHSIIVMDSTIFECLHKLFLLKKPSPKLIPNSLYPRIEHLAILIYQYFFYQVLTITPLDPKTFDLLSPRLPSPLTPSIQLAYKNLFLALPNKQNDSMDFIGCIIALLGDQIMVKQTEQIGQEKNANIKNKQKLNKFFRNLRQTQVGLQQYLMCLYYRLTINLAIATNTAKSILNRFIKCALGNSNGDFGTRMKFLVEWEKVKFNLKSHKNLINEKRPMRKKVLSKGYKHLLKEIFKQNLKQIEQQHEYTLQKVSRETEKPIREGKLKGNQNKAISSRESQRNSVRYWEKYLQTLKENNFELKIQRTQFSPEHLIIGKSLKSKRQTRLYGEFQYDTARNKVFHKIKTNAQQQNVLEIHSPRFREIRKKLQNGHRSKIYTEGQKELNKEGKIQKKTQQNSPHSLRKDKKNFQESIRKRKNMMQDENFD